MVGMHLPLVTLALAVSQVDGFSAQLRRRPAFFSSSQATATALGSSATANGGAFELPDDLPERGADLRRMNEARNRRLQEEEEKQTTFVSGDELHHLRKQVLGLRQALEEARLANDRTRIKALEREILQAQQVDAEFIYTVAWERMEAAQSAGLFEEAEQYKETAMKARSALPQFNLEGLWVGKYGDQGFEMINVTYSGDTLVAHKVTGERNVPKGEASFTVDLSPKAVFLDGEEVLEPIELQPEAAEQWGTKFLHRFGGQGHVASEGGANAQWIDGQLILVGKYFSFAWLPIGHQVFFGRPSPELTLKMLRESKPEHGNDKIREHLQRCVEETEHIEDEMEEEGFLRPHANQEDYFSQEGCFE